MRPEYVAASSNNLAVFSADSPYRLTILGSSSKLTSPFLIDSPMRLKSKGPLSSSLVRGFLNAFATKEESGFSLANLMASLAMLLETPTFNWGVASWAR